MKTANFLTSSCRCCRYYQSQGRRGGMCQQLGVPVQSQWKACALAVHPFKAAWENLEEVVRLEHSLSLSCSDDSALAHSSHSSARVLVEEATLI